MRATDRDTSQAGLYGSDAATMLDGISGGLFTSADSSAYELGFDFGQIFNFATHSTGILVLRYVSCRT